MSIQPPITGDTLKMMVDSPLPKRPAIAEGLIFEKSCLMLAADPGCGKSMLSLQSAMELSAGLPVFSALPVSRPYRVYYIQKERPREEVLERLQALQKVIPWQAGNFYLDDELQRLNFTRPDHADIAINRIAGYNPEVIYIDPIYAGTGGLSKDEIASAFCDFLTQLMSKTGAAIWLNHHTVKQTSFMTYKGEQIEKDDPFYGSQWLKAHVTGSYYVKPRQDQDGTVWSLKKSNHSNLLKELTLSYDPETMLSTLAVDYGKTHDRLLMFIARQRDLNKPFTFRELMTFLGVSHSHARRLIETPHFSNILKKLKNKGRATLYTVL